MRERERQPWIYAGNGRQSCGVHHLCNSSSAEDWGRSQRRNNSSPNVPPVSSFECGGAAHFTSSGETYGPAGETACPSSRRRPPPVKPNTHYKLNRRQRRGYKTREGKPNYYCQPSDEPTITIIRTHRTMTYEITSYVSYGLCMRSHHSPLGVLVFLAPPATLFLPLPASLSIAARAIIITAVFAIVAVFIVQAKALPPPLPRPRRLLRFFFRLPRLGPVVPPAAGDGVQRLG